MSIESNAKYKEHTPDEERLYDHWIVMRRKMIEIGYIDELLNGLKWIDNDNLGWGDFLGMSSQDRDECALDLAMLDQRIIEEQFLDGLS